MTATPLERFEAALHAAGRNPSSGKAKCPAHDDQNPSLSFQEAEDGRLLVTCRAGCLTSEVLAALGLEWPDLFPGDESKSKRQCAARRIAATYDYTDENGDLLYQVVRYEPKGFAQRRPKADGTWDYGLGDVRRVLYRLPELLAAKEAGGWIVVVEGEKDADRLHDLGIVATTCSQGACKWKDEYSASLAGAKVAVIPDNDEPGRQHARVVAESLSRAGVTPRVVELPGLPEKGDVSDWLDQGHSAGEVNETILATEPWSPGPDEEVARPATAPTLVRVSDVEPEQVEWLWPGRLALGKICVLDGDPALGKSTVTLDIAARASTGLPMPDGHQLPEAVAVILLSAEDGIADTIRPRLEAHGADLERVHVLDGVGPWCRPWTTGDTDALRQAIADTGAKLVIIDPLMAYLEANAHKDQEVRKELHPLARLADELGVAILVVRHLNKGSSGNALYRGGGSIGIIGAARSGLIVQADPDDETGHRRVLAVSKCNLAEKAPSLAYHIETDELYGCGRVVWDGPSSHTADSLLVQPVSEEERSDQDEAAEFLRAYLAGGRRPAVEVKDAAQAEGIKEWTLNKAKQGLRVLSEREGFGPGSKVWWSLSPSIDDIHAIDDSSQKLTSMASMGLPVPSMRHPGAMGGTGEEVSFPLSS